MSEQSERNERTVDFTDPQYYLNRELSNLEFNKRVLNEALDERNPLLHRVKFLSIFTQKLLTLVDVPE